ncbi:MAG: hypothetical protein ABFS12_13705 [Bacteroidota bacterium]
MKLPILIGIVFVHLALIFYTIFIIKESKLPKATNSILFFLTAAVIFDIIATTCMMAGTTNTYFTFHGIIGYIGLLAMIIDAVLIWKHKLKLGTEAMFSKGLNLYSKLAYAWWIIAFLTGVMVTINR